MPLSVFPTPVDNQTGLIGAGLGTGGATINLGANWTAQTVAAPSVVRIVLEPSYLGVRSANYEVVYATVVNGSPTATIVSRGMEGTSPVAHLSGVPWVSAGTALDLRSMCTARMSAGTSFSCPANGDVPFDHLDWDHAGMVTIGVPGVSGGRVTAAVKGLYRATAALQINGNVPTDFYLSIMKTTVAGTGVAGVGGWSATQKVATVGDEVELNVGESLTIQSNATVTAGAGSQNTRLAVALVAPYWY